MTDTNEQLYANPDPLPQGLLSFIYNVLHNPSVHQMFFDDSTSLMNTFALTQDEKMAIINSMDSGTATTDDAKTIGELLAQELEENFTGYYKEIW